MPFQFILECNRSNHSQSIDHEFQFEWEAMVASWYMRYKRTWHVKALSKNMRAAADCWLTTLRVAQRAPAVTACPTSIGVWRAKMVGMQAGDPLRLHVHA